MQSETKIHTCSNGLTVLVQPDHAHPVVSVQFWVQTGSELEGKWLGAGLSHLVEHMVFKGTQKLSCVELAEAVQSVGGHWNAYTSETRTVFYINGPSDSWRSFVDILTQLVFYPTFPEEEFEREKEVIRREMAMYRDDPQDAAWKALIGTLYYRSPRRLPVLGEPAQFDRLRLCDLKQYHALRYVPNNVFVTVAGDVDPDEMFSFVEEKISDLSPGDVALPSLPKEAKQWGTRLFRTEFAQPTSTLMLAWRIPDANHPDAPALTVLAHILGTGRTAWLYEYFHDEEGIVHDISASLIPSQGEEGAFVIEADVEREKRDQYRDSLLNYMEKLPADRWVAALKRTCRQLEVARLSRLRTAEGRAQALGVAWFVSGNVHASEEWREALERLTPEDMMRVSATYLRRDCLCEVSVDPLGSNPQQEKMISAETSDAMRTLRLENGLRVVLRPNKRLPEVCACVAFEAGAPSETAETAGINALMSECLMKGTTTRTAAELASVLEDLGGSIHAEVGNNTLTVRTHCLSPDLAVALDVLADVCINPTFPEELVKRERDAMLADVLDSLEDPSELAFRELKRQCYGEVSYGNPTDGSPESIPNLTRELLAEQKKRILCAENAALCLVGDFDCDEAESHIRHTLGAMKRGRRICSVATPPQRSSDRVLVRNKEQTVIVAALPGVNVLSSEYRAVLLLNQWCRDMAGPIFSEIREKRGLAYYAASTVLFGVDAGNFCIYLGTSSEQCDAARRAVEETMQLLYETGMPEETLERVRAGALSAQAMAMQSPGRLCSAIAVDAVLGLPVDSVDRASEQIRGVSVKEVNQVMKRIFSPQAVRTWVTVKSNS